MPQKFDTDRKVLCRNGSYFSIEELWHYLGDEEELYISGEYDNAGKFLGENQIYQDDIIGYLEDHLELWNKYRGLENQMRELMNPIKDEINSLMQQ